MWYTKFRSYWSTLEDPPETGLTITKGCDVAGCVERGDFKAPKSRDDLKDYYWFCLEHVREYNQNWDFFKGMSQAEIERSMSKTAVWDRPTWKSTEAGRGFNADDIRKTAYARFTSEDVFHDFTKNTNEKADSEAHINLGSIPHPAVEALAVMGLRPPVVWADVKTRYKTLAKRYHPDTNAVGNNGIPGTDAKDAEEQLKKINLAYSILKLSYQNYEKLEER
ncbi:MAG: J domain-containing protein [Alphaproteobacteria bacterium]|nr:J domain-containing protein [Alphaproteobacteria bacterium]MDE2336724.1 J domain-containing protein [Alphaproteobacteria bacterium]